MKPMQLAIIHNGQVFPVTELDDEDVREYNFDKPMARADICHRIQVAIKEAEQKMGK